MACTNTTFNSENKLIGAVFNDGSKGYAQVWNLDTGAKITPKLQNRIRNSCTPGPVHHKKDSWLWCFLKTFGFSKNLRSKENIFGCGEILFLGSNPVINAPRQWRSFGINLEVITIFILFVQWMNTGAADRWWSNVVLLVDNLFWGVCIMYQWYRFTDSKRSGESKLWKWPTKCQCQNVCHLIWTLVAKI